MPERVPACKAAVDHNKSDLFGACESDKNYKVTREEYGKFVPE